MLGKISHTDGWNYIVYLKTNLYLFGVGYKK